MERAKSWERAERVAANREAQRHLREARALVAEGFSDPLGLAVASLGWEARAALLTTDFSNAIKLYLTGGNQKAGLAQTKEFVEKTAEELNQEWNHDETNKTI